VARKPASVLRSRPQSTSFSPALSRGFQAQVYPDIWAVHLNLKVDGHSFDLLGREYERDIIRDESTYIVMPKGAQMGLTTVFLVRTFHRLIKRKWHHLYLLPLKTGSKPFVQQRIDPVIDSNHEIKRRFQRVDNTMHKQTTDGIALYIRGTNVWSELREIPVDSIIFDERDVMVEKNIPEAISRLDGSNVKHTVELSTPTVPGHGVDAEEAWRASDMHRWWVRCPHCSRYQVFTVDENIVIGDTVDDCLLRCKHCQKEITDDERAAANATGYWEADNPGASRRGYHINQLNSCTKAISGEKSFMENFFLGQNDSLKMRAWYNNNRGEPYVAAGDQFTPDLLDKCRRKGHSLGGIPDGPVYIGVDVGNFLHCKASYLKDGRRIQWQMKIFADKPGENKFQQLDKWLSGLSSFICVIDAEPEKTMAQELSKKYPGSVWIGFEKDRPDQAEMCVFHPTKIGDVAKVNIDRTAALDHVIKSYMDGNTILAADAREHGEFMPRLSFNGFYNHMCQMVRAPEYDAQERLIYRWKKNKNPDHWHHADMFEMTATQKRPYLRLSPDAGELFAKAGGLISA
jgi:hypothetical protein